MADAKRHFAVDDFERLWIDPTTNELYWDGKLVVTAKRFELYERALGTIVAASSLAVAVVMIGQAAKLW